MTLVHRCILLRRLTFRQYFTRFCTGIWGVPCKLSRRSAQGNPSAEGVKYKSGKWNRPIWAFRGRCHYTSSACQDGFTQRRHRHLALATAARQHCNTASPVSPTTEKTPCIGDLLTILQTCSWKARPFRRHGLSAFLPPKLLLLCRILVATFISCTIRQLWLCVIFPHVKFITSPYQKHISLS